MSDDTSYDIDCADRLTATRGAWDRFGVDNGAPWLTGGHVLGRSLWAFVSDPPTVLLYRDILARVRSGRVVEFGFRCDAPGRRRRMTMRVSPLGGGRVGFYSRLDGQEERPPVGLLDRTIPRAGDMVRVCGWCKKVDAGGVWLEVEDGIERLRLFDRPAVPPLTHGICDRCLTQVTAEYAAD